ncbi:MAG: DUF4198 domain-containing protein [Armatimonadetes bacterium]|nr:DUF4198 domain-containing protein [Armatimonadota bacterium]
MNIRTATISCLTLLCTLAAWQPACAHDWYIQAVDYALPGPGAATIYQGWGHKVPLDDELAGEKIAHLRLLAPGGARTDLKVAPGRSFHVMSVPLDAPGVYTVTGESVPGYYQIYRDRAGKVHHTVLPLDEVKDVGQVFFSCRAFQSPKTYLVVGDAKGASAPAPVASGLEIVLDQLPNALRAGDRLSFRLLMDGKPVATGATYDATYMGYSSVPEDYLYRERPVVEGKGMVDLSCAGVWYVRVHYLVPAPADLQAKCRNFMYNATLTVSVGERQKEEARVTHDD